VAGVAVGRAARGEDPDTGIHYQLLGDDRAPRGFASFAATVEFMPEIVWAELEALAEGARRASERLWQ
jgi:hypothetical protein